MGLHPHGIGAIFKIKYTGLHPHRGRGKDRKRIKIKIPVYGKIDLDEDETDALSIPPKFALFQKLNILDLRHQQQVRDAKVRYGMMDRDFDLEGN